MKSGERASRALPQGFELGPTDGICNLPDGKWLFIRGLSPVRFALLVTQSKRDNQTEAAEAALWREAWPVIEACALGIRHAIGPFLAAEHNTLGMVESSLFPAARIEDVTAAKMEEARAAILRELNRFKAKPKKGGNLVEAIKAYSPGELLWPTAINLPGRQKAVHTGDPRWLLNVLSFVAGEGVQLARAHIAPTVNARILETIAAKPEKPYRVGGRLHIKRGAATISIPAKQGEGTAAAPEVLPAIHSPNSQLARVFSQRDAHRVGNSRYLTAVFRELVNHFDDNIKRGQRPTDARVLNYPGGKLELAVKCGESPTVAAAPDRVFEAVELLRYAKWQFEGHTIGGLLVYDYVRKQGLRIEMSPVFVESISLPFGGPKKKRAEFLSDWSVPVPTYLDPAACVARWKSELGRKAAGGISRVALMAPDMLTRERRSLERGPDEDGWLRITRADWLELFDYCGCPLRTSKVKDALSVVPRMLTAPATDASGQMGFPFTAIFKSHPEHPDLIRMADDNCDAFIQRSWKLARDRQASGRKGGRAKRKS